MLGRVWNALKIRIAGLESSVKAMFVRILTALWLAILHQAATLTLTALQDWQWIVMLNAQATKQKTWMVVRNPA